MTPANSAEALADPAAAASLEPVLAVARAYAVSVDRDGRFPAETFAALRDAGLLAALVPVASSGLGQTLPQVAATCYALGRCCSSSAMILAMHHTQVACLAGHAADRMWLRRFLDRVGREGLLLASVTSEAGVGGNMRASACAVETDGAGRFSLAKTAPTVSYGAQADALLVTARAHPDADPSDQVLVVVPAASGVLAQTGGWDAMGMRGTCSEAFALTAAGSVEQILPAPFSHIAAETMVPVSHLLWSSVWCGIAADAVTRARRFLRGKMRAGSGAVPEGAAYLVQAVERLQAAEARVRQALATRHEADGRAASFADAAGINMVKTSVADSCLAVVEDAMLVCGFAGYANDGPFSVSRHLRDLHSARLMIHNDRIRDNTARLLMMHDPLIGL